MISLEGKALVPQETWDKLLLADKRLRLVLAAVDAQADDETLWCTGAPVGEAYIAQSLRWIHSVAETGDMAAFENIVKQSKGDV